MTDTGIATVARSPDPAERSTWKAVFAGGFLALALVGSLSYVLHDKDSTARATPSRTARPAAGSVAVATPDPPSDVTWELVSGVTVPVSPSAGPTRTDGAVRYGYAHTPLGAVFAALNIATRYAFTPGDGWIQVTQRQVEPGKGRDVFVNAREGTSDLTPPDGGFGQAAGYRLADYTLARARIQVGYAFGSGLRQTSTLAVAWRDGDWRLVLQPDGNPGPKPAAIDNLLGFVSFSAGLFG